MTSAPNHNDRLHTISVLQFMTSVHFGCGARERLPQLLDDIGGKRPLIVSDKGVAAAGVVEQVLSLLPDSPRLPLFLDTPINPTEASARAGADLFKAAGCDSILGVGGGASLDLAKAIAILVNTDKPLWNFCNRHPRPSPIVKPAPLILIPTTSGSGSEVGRSAVIVFDNGIKAGISCAGIVTAAICDPELTLSLPSSVTAVTGMDALSHCIETFCSPTINPPADAIALDGLRRGLAFIERTVNDSTGDMEARWEMMMTALQGAICFQKGMGAVHSLSHPIGALGHHHGTLNAILLPAVLRYNQKNLGVKMAAMERCLPTTVEHNTIADYIEALIGRLGIPSRLSDLGISRAELENIPEQALQDNAHKTNPRILDAADYRLLINQVF